MSLVGKCAVHMRLIDAVRQHEVLYNCDLKDYSDNILKMRLWRLIARKCDIATGEEAKKIWKNLRDGYRCSLKTLKIYEKKEPPRTLKPWKYVEEMDFLRPFMKDRIFTNAAYYEELDQGEKAHFKLPTDDNTMDSDVHAQSLQSSLSSFSGGDTDVQEEIECRPDVTLLAQQELLNQLQSYEGRDSPTLSANISTAQAMAQLEALSNLYPHPNGLQITAGPAPKRRGRKRKTDVDLVPQHLSPLGVERTQSQVENSNPMESPSEDSLKLFFDSMYATAKTLPVPLQRLIRIKLFQTVTDAEMAAESMQINQYKVQGHNSNQDDRDPCDK